MELIRVAASANDIYAHPMARIKGLWLFGGSADSSALIFDAATATGTDKISINTLAKTTSQQMIFETPVLFETGISVTLAGTGAVLYLMVE